MSKSTKFKESGIDITNNQSDLTITIKFSADNSVTWFSGATLYCTCNGTTKSASVSLSAGGSVTKSFTYSNINHNSDGTKSVNWNWSCATGTSALGTVSASGTRTLTTIPRASTVTASDGTIGQTANIKVVKKSSSFTTTLQYKMSGQSNWTTIANKISSSSYTWTLPTSFYNLIQNAKKLTGTIRATTYNGSTNVGYKEDSFTAYANEEACKPVISETSIADSIDLTSLTGDPNRFVRYISRPIMSWVATKQNNAGSISSQKINGISATSPYTANAWSDAYNLVVTDSRGYSSTYNYSMDVIPYVIPTATYNLNRQSPTSSNIILNLNGYYYNGYFDEENTILNTITVEYRYKKTSDISWTTDNITITPDENGEFSIVNLNLGAICDYRYSWNFEIIFKDRIYTGETESTTKKVSTIINKGIPNHNWYEDSEGNNYFNINGTLLINDEPASTGGATSYNDLSNKPSINNVTLSGNKLASDLGLQNAIPGKSLSTNDFTTTYKNNVDSNTSARHTHSNKTVLDGISSSDITNWNNKSTFSGDYDDLENKPTIPTNNNQLTNGAGYITGINSTDVTTALGYTPEEETLIFDLDDILDINSTSDSNYIEIRDAILGDKPFYIRYYDGYLGEQYCFAPIKRDYSGNSLYFYFVNTSETNNNDGVYTEVKLQNTSGSSVTTSTKTYPKQEKLVSGTNIKTINSQSLLGSGDISFDTIQEISGESSIRIKNLDGGIYKIYGNCDLYYNSNDSLSVSDWSYAYLIVTEVNDIQTVRHWVYIGNMLNEVCYGYSWLSYGYCYNVTSAEEQAAITGILSNLTTTAKTNLVSAINELDSDKQDTLVSGTNIKTINNQSILGSGNISLPTSSDIPTKTSDLINDSGYIIGIKDVIGVSKTSATTNYSTSHKNFLPFISTGDYSVDVQIGTGLTWTTKSVSFEEITGTTYGILIPSGISLVKVEANVRYQNPASSQININTMIMRDRNGTSTSLRSMSQSVIANSRYTCNFATYVPVQEGDFIYIGSWKSTASANVSVSNVDNATGVMLEVIQ